MLAILVVGIVLGSVLAPYPRSQAADEPAEKAKGPAEDRPEDRAAIRTMLQSFRAAFESGDVEKTAALMTEGAEIMPDDAPSIRGRDAIKKAYAAYFKEHPKLAITVEGAGLRFISKDAAIADGKIHIAYGNEAPSTERYGILCVREDGKWLVAVIREWPDEDADLQELSWIIGSWEAKRADIELHNTYEWFGDKSFIRGTIRVREKDTILTGMQLIGIDHSTGELRVWFFGSDGGFTQGTCTRENDSWVFETTGISADGEVQGAKNILLRVNNDTATWQPVNLTIGDDFIGDLPPVKVTRVKAAK
jgi:uncharacterized protein (TIGR02246 family)